MLTSKDFDSMVEHYGFDSDEVTDMWNQMSKASEEFEKVYKKYMLMKGGDMSDKDGGSYHGKEPCHGRT